MLLCEGLGSGFYGFTLNPGMSRCEACTAGARGACSSSSCMVPAGMVGWVASSGRARRHTASRLGRWQRYSAQYVAAAALGRVWKCGRADWHSTQACAADGLRKEKRHSSSRGTGVLSCSLWALWLQLKPGNVLKGGSCMERSTSVCQ
jgi:hypothetical protein